MTDAPEELPAVPVSLPRAEIPPDPDIEIERLLDANGLARLVQIVQGRSKTPVVINVNVTNVALNIKELHVGSEYNVSGGQQGAVGDNATAHDFTQNQTVQQPVDVKALAEELGRVAQAARKRATDHEQRIATACLESAEDEAKKGDGPKALEYLKSAGRWVLGVAEDVGAKVAAEAIKSQMGG